MVAAKIAKYIALSVLGLLVVLSATLLVIDDERIEAALGSASQPILSAKHGAVDGIAGITNSVGSWTLNAFGGDNGSMVPSVVQRIPPPPTPSTVAKPVETNSLAEVAAETQELYEQRAMANVEQDSPRISEGTMAQQASDTSETLQADINAQLNADTETSPQSETPATAQMADTEPLVPDAPPPPPQTTDEINPLMAETSEAEPLEPETQEGLTESDLLAEVAGDDVAALPDSPDSSESDPSEPTDTDPTGEQAYTEGLKYYSGQGVERNFGTAAQFFMAAAERGHPGAQYNLGLMNYVGQTGGQDFTNAAKWFQMAAENGHIQAQYNLGFLYYEGKGVEQDLKTAYGWIDRAAVQGYAKAIKARDALKKAMPEIFGS